MNKGHFLCQERKMMQSAFSIEAFSHQMKDAWGDKVDPITIIGDEIRSIDEKTCIKQEI